MYPQLQTIMKLGHYIEVRGFGAFSLHSCRTKSKNWRIIQFIG